MTIGLTVVVILMFGSLALILGAMVRGIQNERKQAKSILSGFSLSIALGILFFATWVGHGLAQWRSFSLEQRTHGERPVLGEFWPEFLQSTLENWQSEFLQLFAIVTLSAVFLHVGSANSRDSQDRIEKKVDKIKG